MLSSTILRRIKIWSYWSTVGNTTRSFSTSWFIQKKHTTRFSV